MAGAAPKQLQLDLRLRRLPRKYRAPGGVEADWKDGVKDGVKNGGSINFVSVRKRTTTTLHG